MLPIVIPTLRRARLQNAEFIPISDGLLELHFATEPGCTKLPWRSLLLALHATPCLRVLVLQNALSRYDTPWEIETDTIDRAPLMALEHLTCSGHRGLARALLYWIDAPSIHDLHIDADFDMGATLDPFEHFPSQLAAELWVLRNSAQTRLMMEYARARANAEDAGQSFTDEVPDSVPVPPLEYLALSIILDSEVEDSRSAWPQLITVAAAKDAEGALRGVSTHNDFDGPGQSSPRRTFTMRNSFAAFPSDAMAAFRARLRRDREPCAVNSVVSLLLTAFLAQAGEEDVISLAFAKGSWLPTAAQEWSDLLFELPALRTLGLWAPAAPEVLISLAESLYRDGRELSVRVIAVRETQAATDEVIDLLPRAIG
ncbi:unnamed protein product [Peniophora sp. CBMAI 1063]|nr:unnamed protein product [Peniophora sp. CBMAI 1063]